MRNIFKLAIVFVLVLLLGGCGVSHNKVKLTFSTWGSQSEIKLIQPVINDFEQKYKVKVELIHIPQNYFQKLHLLFASNQAPDVVFINNYYLPIYYNAGLLTDLTSYFDKNEYFVNAIQAMSIKDKLFAVPRDISNVVVYYNKDIFRKENISFPTENWTYSDFLNICMKLTNKHHWAIGFEENPIFWEPILWSNGGSIFKSNGDFNLNYPQSNDGLKFYIDLRTKYNVAPSKEESSNQTMAQMFLNERIAMQISGRWLVPKYRQEASFDWDVVSLPIGKNGSISGADTSGWAISSISKNKELAIKFIQHLNSKHALESITKSGLITPAKKEIAYSNAFLDGQKPKNAKIFLKINYNAKINTVPIDYNKKIQQLLKILEPYFVGKDEITQYTKFEL